MCSANTTGICEFPVEKAIKDLVDDGTKNFETRCARIYRRIFGDRSLETKSHVQLASVLSRIEDDRVCRNLTMRCANAFPQIVDELTGEREVSYLDAHVVFLVMVEGYRYARLVDERNGDAFRRSFGWIDHIVSSTAAEKVASFMLPSTGSHQAALIQAFAQDLKRLETANAKAYQASAQQIIDDEETEETAKRRPVMDEAKSLLKLDRHYKVRSWIQLSQGLLTQIEDSSARALVERLCPELLATSDVMGSSYEEDGVYTFR